MTGSAPSRVFVIAAKVVVKFVVPVPVCGVRQLSRPMEGPS